MASRLARVNDVRHPSQVAPWWTKDFTITGCWRLLKYADGSIKMQTEVTIRRRTERWLRPDVIVEYTKFLGEGCFHFVDTPDIIFNCKCGE